jgi:hypothetical protein
MKRSVNGVTFISYPCCSRFKRSDLNHYQCLGLWFPQSFELPSFHLRQVHNSLSLSLSAIIYFTALYFCYLYINLVFNYMFLEMLGDDSLQKLLSFSSWNTRRNSKHAFNNAIYLWSSPERLGRHKGMTRTGIYKDGAYVHFVMVFMEEKEWQKFLRIEKGRWMRFYLYSL